MKITHVEATRVRVPMRPSTVNSPEITDVPLDTFGLVPKYILQVHTDEGIVGLGETSRGETGESVRQSAEELEGKDPLCMDLHNLPLPRSAVYDAFEMAIYDIVGKHFGWPVCRLLGGAHRDSVLVDYWMGRCTPEESAARARRGWEMGFHGIKMKAKLEDPLCARIAAIAEAVPDMAMVIDPNERFYRPADAVRLAQRLADYNVAVFESPMTQSHLDWYVLFRQKSPIPVALHLGDPRSVLEAIKQGAVDYLNLGGSMPAFVFMADMADTAGIPCWHGSGVDLGIRDASYIHACAAARGCTLASDVLSFLREDDLIVEGLGIEDGYARVPQEPGLGVTLDEEALERYRI